MCRRTLIVLAVFCMALAPREARAEWFLSPFLGGAFGGGVAEASKVDYGVSAGWLGYGTGLKVIGFEVDVSHRPDFFGADDVPAFLISESSVTSIMFNGLIGVPGGGDRFRPYAAAGVGWLRSRIGGDEDFVRGKNGSFGFNVGGGMFGLLTDAIGLRGDLRYFRGLRDLEGDSEFFSFGSDKLDFWRATGGVTFRF